MRKIQPLALGFIVGILIILFSITGCSDMPYTGSALTVPEVDRYRVSTDGNVVCFEDGIDSTCLKLIPETQNGGPAIHIYPEKQLYLFYHEGNPILRAARVGNNNGNNGGGGNNGNGNGNNGGGGDNNNNNGNGGNNGNNGNNNGDGGNNGNNGNNNGDGGNNGNNGNNNGDGGNNGNNGNNNGDGGNNGSNGNNNGNGGNNGNNGNGGNNGNNGNGGNNGNNGNNNGNGNNGGGSNNNNNNGDDGNNGNNNGNGGNNGNNNGNGGNNGNNGNNNGNNPDDTNDGHGWIIWVYYPEGTAPQNPPTLSESGVTITINGKQLTDDDITGFAQFIGPNNEVGIQFFYETKSAELLDLQVQMEGVLAAEDPVKFNINYLWNSQ